MKRTATRLRGRGQKNNTYFRALVKRTLLGLFQEVCGMTQTGIDPYFPHSGILYRGHRQLPTLDYYNSLHSSTVGKFDYLVAILPPGIEQVYTNHHNAYRFEYF